MRCNAHKQQGIEGDVSKDNTVNYKTCSHCPFHGHLAVCIVQVRTKSFLSHSIDVLCLFTARLFTDHDPHPHKIFFPPNQYFSKLYKLTHITRNILFFFFSLCFIDDDDADNHDQFFSDWSVYIIAKRSVAATGT